MKLGSKRRGKLIRVIHGGGGSWASHLLRWGFQYLLFLCVLSFLHLFMSLGTPVSLAHGERRESGSRGGVMTCSIYTVPDTGPNVLYTWFHRQG